MGAGGAGRLGRRPRPPDLSAEALERAALRYLERYEATVAGLGRVLQGAVRRAVARGAEVDVEAARHEIERVVSRLRSAGLVDDRRYTETKLVSLRRQGASTHAIRAKLRASGVPKTVVDAALAEAQERAGADRDSTELEAARAFVKRRRLGPHRPAADRAARRARDLAALSRAGFSYDIALQALELDGDPGERSDDW
jgi:regulatory protein